MRQLAQKAKYQGLNVTIPYKEAIIPFLYKLSKEAQAIGAVNTIAFENGKAIGHNTDAYGFKMAISPYLKSHHKAALILGTGGAPRPWPMCWEIWALQQDTFQEPAKKKD